jgi:hypothetical protein
MSHRANANGPAQCSALEWRPITKTSHTGQSAKLTPKFKLEFDLQIASKLLAIEKNGTHEG